MLTRSRLKELLDYDPATGIFRWKVNKGNVKSGTVAGGPSGKGYIRVGVDGTDYYAHQLAWYYVHGYFPAHGLQIDHINSRRADNRVSNLRLVSQACNTQNSRIRFDNSSGFRGVHFHSRELKYHARITVNGKRIHLGSYSSALEAATHRLAFIETIPHLWNCDARKLERKNIVKHLFEMAGVIDGDGNLLPKITRPR